ncbi:hypothetical protein Pdw03_7032 [Penicillium digitatum]|uniref:Uncharacterized protein n=3 Tax=Penicillium digitatum TaxID=36651 RepID=K9FXD6_PEND2|nr:hypothetical protein PDIP_53100 [Penicillium digitatum Pd1]EKV12163.1 hypothetical protein PDIP_53100 [Penicillium digitatum Pd1]EKV14335.1 hypothetical protein PDIG_33510 [Penicillium digitatum PHI26]KAG0156067.1 hypothetical protein PDIDSM_3243 [Penicillium digitatum]QQK43131.1 hypothetical protein Pdw03_7032 [Penicillium digitatum]
MDGARLHPYNFRQIYVQACETFTHKLQCQVFVLLSQSPSPDMEEISTRLEELCERVIQIGFLGGVGEFGVRDDSHVRIRWGSLPIKEICFEIKWELTVIKDELASGSAAPVLVADLLVDVLDNLPF